MYNNQPKPEITREGDYLQTLENIIFAVKGFVHPPTHIIAFPKYIPNKESKKGYSKIESLTESYNFLRQHYPEYLRFDPVFNEILGEVPKPKIKKIFSPKNFLKNLLKKEILDKVEKDAVDFVNLILDNSSLPISSLGISGSLMVGFHTENSDIDLVVYGFKQAKTFYEFLKKMVKDEKSQVKQYTEKDLQRLYRFRVKDTEISFKQFVQVETRKFLQGKFRGRDYFIRLVKESWEQDEKYGEKYYFSMGQIEFKAKVVDDSESIFTPTKYVVDDVSVLNGLNVNVEEVVSYRGRFCEQAKKTEKIFVRGKLEKVLSKKGEYYRVLVGNSKKDIIIPLEA